MDLEKLLRALEYIRDNDARKDEYKFQVEIDNKIRSVRTEIIQKSNTSINEYIDQRVKEYLSPPKKTKGKTNG